MITCKKFILVKEFQGFPKESDVKIVEEQLPPLQNGQYLCQSLYISVDPYQRAYKQKIGEVLIGSQVARIIESKNSKFPVGKIVVAYYGWKTHGILNESSQSIGIPTVILPEIPNIRLSYYLGILGMPGVSAYFGLLEICKPKPGETVVVTAAAGAVGSVVGQIAKLKGCKTIGVVGSEEKGKWITNELGFDAFVNYKDKHFAEALKKAAPDGIDCYFDNVGGDITNEILQQMNDFGRISVCGAVSTYNGASEDKVSLRPVIFKQLKMEGFIVTRWMSEFQNAMMIMVKWMKEEKLATRETVTKGFDNTFKAFLGMLKGENVGKAIVEI